ncbi:MAG: amidohydrolase family protein [Ruminococcus sp.]|jgi:imidazolonepropionase-like amidohydrolase|nr:amidohydrolase family protein [Ruminococcus sp.]
MVIIGDKIYMPDGKFISGLIYLADGKIDKIKELSAKNLREFAVPQDFSVDIDARGLIIYPGFIDCHTHLGLYASGIGIEGDDINENSDPVTPQLRTIDALDPFEPEFFDARKAGITSVITGSGSANVIGGDLIAVKTEGKIADEMLIKTVGIKFALGENPKSVHGDKNSPPVTRMGIAALIREALTKAVRYRDDISKAETDNEELPEYDIKSEALLPLLRGEIKAHFHCHKACDIVTAVRIAEEFNLKYTLIHCTEGYKIADFLSKKRASAVIGPIISSKAKPELADISEKNAGILQTAGVATAICTDHPEIPEHYLYLSAKIAEEYGLRDSISAITSEAAKIAGIDNRVGYIKAGYDADFVIAEEVPFKVKYTIINGKIVYNENAE